MAECSKSRSAQIGELAALLSHVHQRLLRLVAEVGSDEVWRADGACNVEAWLVAHLKLSWPTARAWAEAASRLEELPEISAGFAEGLLSFDQVKTLVRFATAEDDASLAVSAPEESVNRLQQKARQRERVEETKIRNAAELRSLRWWDDKHARLIRLQGALTEADGATVIGALERLMAQAPSDPDHTGPGPLERRRADALTQLASQGLGADADPDRATVVLHLEASVLTDPDSVADTEHGFTIPNASWRRMTCDCRIETSRRDPDGVIVGIGRATRRIPAWLSRALKHRDLGCRFPGCERTRWVNAHHLLHWADGGPTDLDNLITLCYYHHTLVHDHGWSVVGDPNVAITWIRPCGTPYTPGRSVFRESQIQCQQLLRDFTDRAVARASPAA